MLLVFQRVALDLTGSHWVSLGCTGFYWVLLGFTGFFLFFAGLGWIHLFFIFFLSKQPVAFFLLFVVFFYSLVRSVYGGRPKKFIDGAKKKRAKEKQRREGRPTNHVLGMVCFLVSSSESGAAVSSPSLGASLLIVIAVAALY